MIDSGSASIEIRGEQLLLLPERAMHWPAAGMLLIADMHCGKAATFRARHVPIPDGNMEADLAILSAVLERTGASSLAILGDWIHAAVGCTKDVMQAIDKWRAQHAQLQIHWIHGNHDVAPEELRSQFSFEEDATALDRGPFRLQHKPGVHQTLYTLAGHVHPKFAIGGHGIPRTHLPCFLFTPDCGILPSFGSFTGGMQIKSKPKERIFLVAGGNVLEWKR